MTQVKMAQKQVFILSTRVDGTSKSQVLAAIGKKLASSHKKDKFYVVTPNPEIVLLANRDKKLQDIINKADFSVPDGIGLKIFGDSGLDIYHGRKLMLDLLSLANKKRLKVFFVTSSLLNTKDSLLKKVRLEYSNIKAQAMVGPRLNINAECLTKLEAKIEKELVEKINKFAPDLVFVCYGASKQEKWIAKWLPKLKIKGAIGIGGALDYYAGTKLLPPKWMEKVELEWLWRMFSEAKHAQRVFNAVVVFPLTVFADRFTSK